jgi:hypothetical protein
MLWIDVYDSTFQFPPISSHFAQPLQKIGTTLEATINNLINAMERRCVTLHEANGDHTPLPRYLWPIY